MPFMSTKSMTGHTLGAAGAIEAVLCCIMLESKLAVRNHNFVMPDDSIATPPIAEHRSIAGRRALSTSLAFGGSNSVLLIERSC